VTISNPLSPNFPREIPIDPLSNDLSLGPSNGDIILTSTLPRNEIQEIPIFSVSHDRSANSNLLFPKSPREVLPFSLPNDLRSIMAINIFYLRILQKYLIRVLMPILRIYPSFCRRNLPVFALFIFLPQIHQPFGQVLTFRSRNYIGNVLLFLFLLCSMFPNILRMLTRKPLPRMQICYWTQPIMDTLDQPY